MKHIKLVTIFGSTLACAVGTPDTAVAGGLELYEIGTPDVGLASAGYSARAQDASTLFKNPAGMSLLQGSQFQGGAQLTYGSVEFSHDANTSARLGTDNGGNAIGALPAGSLFYVHDLGERFKVGAGTFSYFGLISKYDDNWVGRYYLREGDLVGMSIMPAASFKVTDWLSVGGGLNAMYGFLKNRVAVNNLDPAFGDGELKVKDEAWGFGGNAGILVTPFEGTRLGVTYLSQVKLDFQDTPSFSGLGPGLSRVLANPSSIDQGMTVPQSVMFGFYQKLSPKWAVMGDVGWQQWSRFGEVFVGVENGAVTTQLNYQDTWHGAIGAQYTLNEKWQFTGGFAYDTSAVSDSDRTVQLPMGVAYRIGLGPQYNFNEKLQLGAAYEFLWGGDMPVDQGAGNPVRGRVSGSYNDSWFSFFTVNLTYRF